MQKIQERRTNKPATTSSARDSATSARTSASIRRRSRRPSELPRAPPPILAERSPLAARRLGATPNNNPEITDIRKREHQNIAVDVHLVQTRNPACRGQKSERRTREYRSQKGSQ